MNDSYTEIGELLKAARQEMHISIPDAAARLHIRPRYLEALEAGNLRELPGISYTRGYIARYATFLRLDKDEVLRRFDRVEAAIGRRGFYLPLTFSKEKRPTQLMVWGALALALMLYLGWSQMVPRQGQAPVVESIEKAQARKIILSADSIDSNPCLAPQERLYPACFWQEMGFDPAALLLQAQYDAAVAGLAQQNSVRSLDEELAKSPVPPPAAKPAPAKPARVAKPKAEETDAAPEETADDNEDAGQPSWPGH